MLSTPFPLQGLRAEGDGTPKEASGGRFPEGRQDIEQETREKVQSPLEMGAGKPESLATKKRTKAIPLGPGSDGKGQEVGCLSKVIKAVPPKQLTGDMPGKPTHEASHEGLEGAAQWTGD